MPSPLCAHFTVFQPTNEMNKIIILILIRAREGYGNGIEGSCCCLMPSDWLHTAKFPDNRWRLEKKTKLLPSSSPSSSSSFKFNFQFILSFVQRFSFCCSIRVSLSLNAKCFAFVGGSQSFVDILILRISFRLIISQHPQVTTRRSNIFCSFSLFSHIFSPVFFFTFAFLIYRF